MNNYDFYVPIDIHGPIKTAANINIPKSSSKNPVIMFQLFDKCHPLMLDDISKVSIAFTNTDNVSVSGSGYLQVVNPHRGTISYEVDNADLTMSGLITITLGITTSESFFTVQCVAHCQDISDSLMDALGASGSGSGSGGNNSNGSNDNDFPCGYYNAYCRMCRRCKWAWENNTYPKPLCFEEMKMCKNPFITPPIVNMAVLPEYTEAPYEATVLDNGNIGVNINNKSYICDIGKDGALYIADKTKDTPDEFVNLYLGPKMKTYYKTDNDIMSYSEEDASTLDMSTLFN